LGALKRGPLERLFGDLGAQGSISGFSKNDIKTNDISTIWPRFWVYFGTVSIAFLALKKVLLGRQKRSDAYYYKV